MLEAAPPFYQVSDGKCHTAVSEGCQVSEKSPEREETI